MADLVLTRAIEERTLNAWPAIETLIAGDWMLRFANGYSKRANSASTLAPGAAMDDAAIDWLIARSDDWNVPPTVRLTPLCAPGLDARLERRGFAAIEPTFGMIAPLDAGAPAADARVRFAPRAEADWMAANAAAYGGVKADAAKLAAILSRIRPKAAFATLSDEGGPAAWGIAVAERGYVGLQDITVAPARRGGGLGRALVVSLMAWGRDAGAQRAYLHVAATNEPARALYRSLGFVDVYRITHRALIRD
ncbi:MAG: hypothetical protein BGP06_20910 [Rhizobiales bacterium 65-9]|nr:GNAT family N-acetyltransferase [Hyphomicrobiales bacterium]OJY36485.1 MAG: hypothetical protein BGP06_20910 [Rhizobiales bacterium 65-9]